MSQAVSSSPVALGTRIAPCRDDTPAASAIRCAASCVPASPDDLLVVQGANGFAIAAMVSTSRLATRTRGVRS